MVTGDDADVEEVAAALSVLTGERTLSLPLSATRNRGIAVAEIAGLPIRGVPSRAAQVALWLPGPFVAAGAIAVTAHGRYEGAIVAKAPPAIAWLDPMITDGLALVAYAAAARLQGPRRYAWAVVMVAAGLLGLEQAAYLTGDAAVAAPAALRFGVGAWPGVAAAIVAELIERRERAPGSSSPVQSG